MALAPIRLPEIVKEETFTLELSYTVVPLISQSKFRQLMVKVISEVEIASNIFCYFIVE
jgi:hypothetical protein